jgi:hypothetical protein
MTRSRLIKPWQQGVHKHYGGQACLITLCGEIFRTSAVSSTLTSRETQLDDTRFARVYFRKRIQRVINGH